MGTAVTDAVIQDRIGGGIKPLQEQQGLSHCSKKQGETQLCENNSMDKATQPQKLEKEK